jgi:DNA polymerase III delta prime subunit
MLDHLLKEKRIPSPLILEGEASARAEWLLKIRNFALCFERRACGECRACKQMKKGFHPDAFDLNGTLKMEELRDFLYKFRQKPFEGGLRVLTIDDFQEASTAIQNALLKTLEEPLPHWVLVLGTNSRFAILETIRSRCLLYTLPVTEEKTVSLTSEEKEIFELVEAKNETALVKNLETFLKDRNKAKKGFQNLLREASLKRYPGHWEKVAPVLEAAVEKLDRNLNSRLVWDNLWAKSFTEII